MKKYRLIAVAVSVLVHALLLLVVGRFIKWESSSSGREEVMLYLFIPQRPMTPERQPRVAVEKRVRLGNEKRASGEAMPSAEVDQPIASDIKGVETVPERSLVEEPAREEFEDIEKNFFGDSLYSILQEHPELKPLVLGQMLVQHVPAKDSLETIREQIAQALKPYAEMSEGERAARANMKRFGTARNPYQAQAIPGNIPISDIIRFLIQLLSK